MSLGRAVEASSNGNQQISWQPIEEEVAKDFHVRLNYVIDLRKCFFKEGVVVVIGPQDRG